MRHSYLIFFLLLSITSCIERSYSEPIEVSTPTSVTTTVTYDSLAFFINVYKDHIKVKLQEKETQLKGMQSLDTFMAANTSTIGKNNIVLFTPTDLPYETFKALMDVFKKHGHYRFSIASEPQ